MSSERTMFYTQTVLSFFFFRRPRSTHMFTELNVKKCFKKEETKPCPGYKRFIVFKNKLQNQTPHMAATCVNRGSYQPQRLMERT